MDQAEIDTRRAQHRELAIEGLTEREIAERTGSTKGTVHRDLEGWELTPREAGLREIMATPPGYGYAYAVRVLAQREGDALDDADLGKYAGLSPDEMIAEADRLTKIQREKRGSVPTVGLDGKPSSRPGPYEPTADNEQRAREILALRRTANRAKNPVRRAA